MKETLITKGTNNQEGRFLLQKTNTMNIKPLIAAGATLLLATSAFAATKEEVRESVKAALQANDYSAYVEARESYEGERELRVLPEEVFSLKANLIDARESEDEEAIEEIKTELKEYRAEKKAARQENREAKKVALEANDLEAFNATLKEGKTEFTQEAFELVQKARAARESGDRDAVKAAREQLKALGYEGPRKGKKGRGGRNR